MRKRKQQVSKNNLTVSKRTKRSSASGGEIRYFDRIHVDLFFDILSKLPTKDIAKCRCISKLWSSIIRIPNYNHLFPIKYPVTPRLLFAFQHSRKVIFYSSPQPQNPNENSSLVATHYDHKNFLSKYSICKPVLGLVCRQYFSRNDTLVAVYNPMTGEYVTLPKPNLMGIKSEWLKRGEIIFCGYDPIDKQFKVLNITWSFSLGNSYFVSRVLTLGTGQGNLSWRKIECDAIRYDVYNDGICINGVLYYPARLMDNKEYTIVCFDVRSEKFSFINVDQDMATKIVHGASMKMIDFKGKLSACIYNIKHAFFELWILDGEKHKWSKHSYQMPLTLLGEAVVRVCGMTGSGEIVLHPCYVRGRGPFFIFYYNLERNIVTKVRVQVPNFEFLRNSRVYTFPNYFEDVRFM